MSHARCGGRPPSARVPDLHSQTWWPGSELAAHEEVAGELRTSFYMEMMEQWDARAGLELEYHRGRQGKGLVPKVTEGKIILVSTQEGADATLTLDNVPGTTLPV